MFCVGETVVCVDARGASPLTWNHTYKIKSVSSTGMYVGVDEVYPFSGPLWFSDRFERVGATMTVEEML